jgi:hypothetical protein
MLSGTDGLNNSSTENVSRDKPSTGKSLEATLANRSASELFNLGIEFILKVENLFIKFHTSDWYILRCEDRQWIESLTYLTTILELPKIAKF